MGMLSDRFGGRSIFTVLLVVSSIPVFFVPRVTTYDQLLVVAFFLGLAGSSFAVGVNYVSRWTPAERRGGALGVYGLGNIGQSFAVFLGPVLAGAIGFVNVYSGLGAALLVWAAVFAVLARSPEAARPRGIGEMLGVLTREPLSWVLASFIF
jgi:NNP family nitrate/nitrite transporter-like MFS transporter